MNHPATASFYDRYKLVAAETTTLASPIQSSMNELSVDWKN